MSVWVTLLLEKIAPLCPTLARKLRLVCKRFAENLPAQTPLYSRIREIYESPFSWIKDRDVDPEYGIKLYSCLGGFVTEDPLADDFLPLIVPEIYAEMVMRCYFYPNNSFICTWDKSMRFVDGPITFSSKAKESSCQLGCECCLGGPDLLWAWTIRIDPIYRVFYIRVESLKDVPEGDRPQKKCKH